MWYSVNVGPRGYHGEQVDETQGRYLTMPVVLKCTLSSLGHGGLLAQTVNTAVIKNNKLFIRDEKWLLHTDCPGSQLNKESYACFSSTKGVINGILGSMLKLKSIVTACTCVLFFSPCIRKKKNL